MAEKHVALATLEHRGPQLAEQLQRCTVFFSIVNQSDNSFRLVGSGVVADLHGAKVVLTAGHLLEEHRRPIEDGVMAISVNQRRGRLMIKPDATRLISSGGQGGPDAGVLILPPEQTPGYFEYGGFEPVRLSTLRLDPPLTGMDCIIAGYPGEDAYSVRVEREGRIENERWATLRTCVAYMLPPDGPHYWVDASLEARDVITRMPLPFEEEGQQGMSGCGFWSMLSKRDSSTGPSTTEGRLVLHGVHTGTDGARKRFRETPIRYHLQLLAGLRTDLRSQFAALLPSLRFEADPSRV